MYLTVCHYSMAIYWAQVQKQVKSHQIKFCDKKSEKVQHMDRCLLFKK